jgi:hypothetical protein
MRIASEIEIAPPLARIEVLLQTWADYDKSKRDGGVVTHGYPTRSCGFVGGGSSTVEDMEDSVDCNKGINIAAILKGLAADERSAIRHQYLDEDYEGLIVFYGCTLRRAKGRVEAAAKRRGIW